MNVSGLGISLLIIIGFYKALGEDLETEKLFGAISVLLMAHDLGTRLFAVAFHFFTLLRTSAARLTKVIMLSERKDYRDFVESKYALRIINGSFSWGQ